MGMILSILIENERARVSMVTKTGAYVTAHDVFEVQLPSAVIDDGMIMDVDAIARVLSSAFESNNIKKGKIAFVISSRKIANKDVVIPYVKNRSKVGEMIAANIDEYFPMNNLEDYIFRHTILDTIEDAEGKHYSVAVTAFQKELIEGYQQLAEMLKMPIYTIDYYSNSIYQLLLKQLNHGVVLALQMNLDITYVSIMRGKAQLFKRSVPYGRNTIVKNVAELKNIRFEEAEKMVTDPDRLRSGLTQEEYGEVIRDFAGAITRVAEYHTNRNPGTVIELTKVMGSGIDLLALEKVLGKELGVDVLMVREPEGIKISKKNPAGLNYEKIADYLPGIAALLAPLNLRLEEEKKSIGGNTVFLILIAIAVVVNAIVSGSFLYKYRTLQDTKAKIEEEIASVAGAEATYNAYLNALAECATIQGYYDGTKNNNELLYQMIVDLEQIMPESVGITNLASENGEIHITGIAGGKDVLAKYVIELKKIAYIKNIRVEDNADTYDEFGNATTVFNMTYSLDLHALESEAAEGDVTALDAATETMEGGQ